MQDTANSDLSFDAQYKDVLFKYIDRLSDPSPETDPLEKIVGELVAAFNAVAARDPKMNPPWLVEMNERRVQHALDSTNPDPVIRKMGAAAKEHLTALPSDTPVTVITTLVASRQASPSLSPSDYATRTDYRRALMVARKEQMQALIAPIKARLEGLGVTVHGGKWSLTLVLAGRVADIVRALAFDEIRSASLDSEEIVIAEVSAQ